MSEGILSGKTGVVFGVANKRSIAWAIAKAWHKAGARLIFNYQGERLKENVQELVSEFGSDVALHPCDVTKDEEIDGFFASLGSKHQNLICCSIRWPTRQERRLKAILFQPRVRL